MKRQLQGIALILFGIFLALAAMTDFLGPLTAVLWIAACTLAIAGLILAWQDEK